MIMRKNDGVDMPDYGDHYDKERDNLVYDWFKILKSNNYQIYCYE